MQIHKEQAARATLTGAYKRCRKTFNKLDIFLLINIAFQITMT